jgi:RES domain-containing protein
VLTAWRIVTARHAATAFDGEGARRYGGRWNSPGVAVVYAAGTRSLAALEMVVHLGPGMRHARFVLIGCRFPDGLVERVDVATLPRDWRQSPPPAALAAIGDAWASRGSSAVLAVPSALVPEETNYLINPRHADAAAIEVGQAEPFTVDGRLLQ